MLGCATLTEWWSIAQCRRSSFPYSSVAQRSSSALCQGVAVARHPWARTTHVEDKLARVGRASWALVWPWANSNRGWTTLLMRAGPSFFFLFSFFQRLFQLLPIPNDFPILPKCSKFENAKHHASDV
jgi:hypothetical protein